MNIECPATMRRHVQQVLGGEYDVRYRATQPGILDIGANVGSFAAWALKRWPACYVHCYEPLPDNFALLKKNLGQVEGASVSLHNFAVGDPSLKQLYLGRNNCGEACSNITLRRTGGRVDELHEEFLLVGGDIRRPHRGTLKFMHKRLFATAPG